MHVEAEENHRKPKSLHLVYKPVEYTAAVLPTKLQHSVTETGNALDVTEISAVVFQDMGHSLRENCPFPCSPNS
jgi:hypothetical protein